MSAALSTIQAAFQPSTQHLIPPPQHFGAATSAHFPQWGDACKAYQHSTFYSGAYGEDPCARQGNELCVPGRDATQQRAYIVRGQALQPAPESLGQAVLASCGPTQQCGERTY